MPARRCPFCQSDASRIIGTRVDAWAKCLNCRSIFRDITTDRFDQLHNEAFQDSTHIDAVLAFAGEQPFRALWDLLALPGDSVLEIGPGSGHLLAAASQAGCSVEAVESSAVHREYIRDTWGIDAVHATMDEIAADRTFDAIIAINVFEHIYDITAFLRAVRKVLAPGGTFFISAPNAASLEAAVLRTWWSMCKVHDHVSFPSPPGLAAAARESGLRVGRIWSTGLPFEFGVSTLVACRDRVRAHRGIGKQATAIAATQPQTHPTTAGLPREADRVNPAVNAAIARFYSMAAPFDPACRVIGALGRAGSVKARLIHP
jgi:2-polyprenyl-6-hydroxyphenyl methylase/3-demethylubiquinone-9 3-methyltransferase